MLLQLVRLVAYTVEAMQVELQAATSATDGEMDVKPLPSTYDLLVSSCKLIFYTWKSWLFICTMLTLVTLTFTVGTQIAYDNLVDTYERGDWAAWFFLFLFLTLHTTKFTLESWLQLSSFFFIRDFGLGGAAVTSASILSAFNNGKRHITQYLFCTSVVTILVACGLVLLVIPGILLWLWYGLTALVSVFENKNKLVDALDTSQAYIHGRMLPVLWRYSVLLLLLFTPYFLCSIVELILGESWLLPASLLLSGLLFPLHTSYYYLLYISMKPSEGLVV